MGKFFNYLTNNDSVMEVEVIRSRPGGNTEYLTIKGGNREWELPAAVVASKKISDDFFGKLNSASKTAEICKSLGIPYDAPVKVAESETEPQSEATQE